MSKRILLAAVLGAVAMFAWSSIAHIVTPLGEVGVQEIQNEGGLLSEMQTTVASQSGFYFFPGLGTGPGATREQKRAAMKSYDQKLASMPSGILIYNPPGEKSMTGRQLATEFLTEFVEALLIALVLAGTRATSLRSRTGVALLIGILASMTTNVPYWNWYKFPGNYTAANMVVVIVGFTVAGMVAALVLGRGMQATRTAHAT